jgi:hypothetical protein
MRSQCRRSSSLVARTVRCGVARLSQRRASCDPLDHKTIIYQQVDDENRRDAAGRYDGG